MLNVSCGHSQKNFSIFSYKLCNLIYALTSYMYYRSRNDISHRKKCLSNKLFDYISLCENLWLFYVEKECYRLGYSLSDIERLQLSFSHKQPSLVKAAFWVRCNLQVRLKTSKARIAKLLDFYAFCYLDYKLFSFSITFFTYLP